MAAKFSYIVKRKFKEIGATWRWTLFEVLIIIVTANLILHYPRQEFDAILVKEANDIKMFDVNLTSTKYFRDLTKKMHKNARYTILYKPDNNYTQSLINRVEKRFPTISLRPASNKTEDIQLTRANILALGILDNGRTGQFHPTLRFQTTMQTCDGKNAAHDDCYWLTRCRGSISVSETPMYNHVDYYFRENFAQLYHALFMAWLRKQIDTENNTENAENAENAENSNELSMEEKAKILEATFDVKSLIIPTQGHFCNMEVVTAVVWFATFFIFFLSYIHIILLYGNDKEKNIIVHHWIYGYTPLKYNLAHFVASLVYVLCTALILLLSMLILSNCYNSISPLTHMNFIYLVLLLIEYAILLVLSSMIVVMMCTTAVNAALYGTILWLIHFGICGIIYNHPIMNTSSIIGMHLFFNTFLPLGLRDIFRPDLSDISVHEILIHEFINIIIMLGIVTVLNYMFPGNYIQRSGIAESFCCLRRPFKSNEPNVTPTLERPHQSWQHFEYGPIGGTETIFVKNVITFNNSLFDQKQTLRSVTMRFFRGEITVLLGAHESGKTFLLSVLTGWVKPAVGEVYFDGTKSIYTYWTEYRKEVDACMWENPLCTSLSVKDNLIYLATIKQHKYNREELYIEVSKYLRILVSCGIAGNKIVKNLAYSKRRLVTLAGVLICNRSIILLKDPTKHMCFEDQRHYWRILRKAKIERTIVISTTSIDEAEEIGDRIAIFNDGNLLACGSQFFLRTNFGVGFDLIILKEPKVSSAPITELIASFIPNIVPDNQIGDEVFYKLPGELRSEYESMLLALEDKRQDLGIYSIQITGSELNEVYMTLSMDSNLKSTVPEVNKLLLFLNEVPKKKKKLQFYAMLYKKMLNQAPRVIPITMFLVVVVLIMYFPHLCYTLELDLSYTKYLNFGLLGNGSSRENFDRFSNCTFVEAIRTSYKKRQHIHVNSFIPTKYICGDIDYYDYIHANNYSQKHDKLGAAKYDAKTNTFKVWINTNVFHSSIVALNLAHNLMLGLLFPNNTDRVASVRSEPAIMLPTMALSLQQNNYIDLRLPMVVGVIMPLIMSPFIVPIVEEYNNNLNVIQRLAGVGSGIMWTVSIFWDMLTFVTLSVIYVLLLIMVMLREYNFTEKFLLFCLFNIHAMSMLPFLYLFAFFVHDKPMKVFMQVIFVQYLTGLIMYDYFVNVIIDYNTLYYLMNTAPAFSLLDAVGRLNGRVLYKRYCENLCNNITDCTMEKFCDDYGVCCDVHYLAFADPGLMQPILFMLGTGAVYSILFFCLSIYRRESGFSLSRSKRQRGLGTVSYPQDDDDVKTERMRIAAIPDATCREYRIFADQLEDRIPRHSRRLNTVSFALHKCMSMGVYGSHQSGKSKLLRQLVRAHPVRFGDLYMNKYDVKCEAHLALNSVGYCAQSNAFHALTPRQLFTLMFMIRSVPRPAAVDKVRQLVNSLDIGVYMNIRLYYLPLHVKRRVFIGISLIASNKVLIFDEPTDGMPAHVRRIILNLLRYARFCGKTVVFSSCEGVECETLADYIIVVDKGELLGIGSPQYLRQKYTVGFYLDIKLSCSSDTVDEAIANIDRDMNNVIRFVMYLNDHSELIYRGVNFLSFYVPLEKVQFSALFGILEKNRSRLNIADYTISQGSLVKALENILHTRSLREPYKKKKQKGDKRLRYVHSKVALH